MRMQHETRVIANRPKGAAKAPGKPLPLLRPGCCWTLRRRRNRCATATAAPPLRRATEFGDHLAESLGTVLEEVNVARVQAFYVGAGRRRNGRCRLLAGRARHHQPAAVRSQSRGWRLGDAGYPVPDNTNVTDPAVTTPPPSNAARFYRLVRQPSPPSRGGRRRHHTGGKKKTCTILSCTSS